ncbi:MAG: hypothetical protein ABF586_09310, partial [Sporolactobacillus sp.]
MRLAARGTVPRVPGSVPVGRTSCRQPLRCAALLRPRLHSNPKPVRPVSREARADWPQGQRPAVHRRAASRMQGARGASCARPWFSPLHLSRPVFVDQQTAKSARAWVAPCFWPRQAVQVPAEPRSAPAEDAFSRLLVHPQRR